MDPIDFEASLERATRLEDVWRRWLSLRARARRAADRLPSPAAARRAGRAACCGSRTTASARRCWRSISRRGSSGIAALGQRCSRTARGRSISTSSRLAPSSARASARISRPIAPPGWSTASAMQAFGPNGRNGIFAHRPRPRPAGGWRPRRMTALRWACQAMHLRYCELLLPTLGRGAGALVARGRGAALGGARQEQRRDRRDPRHLGAYRRRPPAAGLPQARGVRPDLGGAARPRVRADQPRPPDSRRPRDHVSRAGRLPQRHASD